MAASRVRCEQPRRTIEAGEFRPYVIVLNHQDNAGVLAPLHLPFAVKWREMLLIVGDDDRAKRRGSGQVALIALTFYMKLNGQINQMARRAKLTGQPMIDYAVVKV